MSSGSIAVELLDHMGSDLSVVNAARVSFDKESEWERVETTEPFTFTYTPTLNSRDADYGPEEITRNVTKTTFRLSERDTKLIKYLADHNHWSPFAHCFASFRISSPIFVARQLQKHTVGLAWNEVSRRYVDAEPTFYTPETWRKRAENVKQGSSDEAVDTEDFKVLLIEAEASARDAYDALLEAGVCPEQARMVLPQSMMTQWIWSGSLYAFARVCNLRLDSHAQRETQEVAKGISEHMAKLFPESWKVLINV